LPSAIWSDITSQPPAKSVVFASCTSLRALRAVTHAYFRIFATTPAPTVLPPSRMAKRSPSSIAIGLISSTLILMLSPGMIISVPAGNSIAPVTSVVRK